MARSSAWTRTAISRSLRVAARDLDVAVLSHARFRQWASDNNRPVPSITTIVGRFGSWSDACRSAGLAANATKYGGAGVSPSARVTVDDCRRAVREFVAVSATLGEAPSTRLYQQMYRSQGWPAFGTVRSRLDGTWGKIISSRGGVPTVDTGVASKSA